MPTRGSPHGGGTLLPRGRALVGGCLAGVCRSLGIWGEKRCFGGDNGALSGRFQLQGLAAAPLLLLQELLSHTTMGSVEAEASPKSTWGWQGADAVVQGAVQKPLPEKEQGLTWWQSSALRCQHKNGLRGDSAPRRLSPCGSRSCAVLPEELGSLLVEL